jgi:hypothetical protein
MESKGKLNLDALHHRFVVLRHEVGQSFDRTGEDHLDWMFEQEDSTLQTWATPLIGNLQQEVTLAAQRLNDHRVEYLEFEGPISGGRGTVTRWLSGTYCLRFSGEQEIRLSLHWNDDGPHRAELRFYRMRVDDASCRELNWEGWRLRVSPC